MKKSAIIFSTYIPTIESGLIVSDYLQAIEKNFTVWDCDIYTGINYCYFDKILDVYFGRFSYNSDYEKVDDLLMIDSDASAYQKALELYMHGREKLISDYGEDYEYVWFIHSKSVTSKCHNFRKEVIEDFINRRKDIEEFMRHNNLAAFYPWVSQCSIPKELNGNLNKILTTQDNDLYVQKFWGLTSQYTFYVFSGYVLDKFFKNIKDDFFKKNLIRDYGMNKYFFENDFCMIPFKLGFDRFGYDKQGDRLNFLDNRLMSKTFLKL